MRLAVPAPPGLEAKGYEASGGAAGMADLAQMVQYASQAPEQAGPAAQSTTTAACLLQEHQQLGELQQLQQMLLQQHLMHQLQQQQLQPQQACGPSGEWVEAVLSAAPLLDAEGMKAALAILDKAVSNLHRVKLLDGMIANTYIAGGVFTSMPHLRVAEEMRAQVLEEQQALLHQLHQLRALAGGALPGPRRPQGRQLDLQALAQQQEPLPARPPWSPQPPRGLPAAAPDWSQAAQPADPRMQTLSSSLQLLADEDPDCLFIVRRINKLGFKAPKRLKRYFSSCGPVSQVLTAHSTVHAKGDPALYPRRRPSSLGFVHMATPEGARRALALGEEQTVDHCVISVQRFERQRKDCYEDLEEEDDDCEGQGQDCQQGGLSAQSLRLGKSDDWKRQQSAPSTRSTATGDEDDAWKGRRSAASNRSAKGSGSGSASEAGSASRGGSFGEAAEEGPA